VIHLAHFSLLFACVMGTSPATNCQEEPAPASVFHDPLATLSDATDDVGRTVLAAYDSYDVKGLVKALAVIDARLGTKKEQPEDRYVLAQGYIELALMRRYYEKEAEDDMPAILEAMDPDEISETGIAHAAVYAEAHPDHADIVRVHGELVSTQIRGMMGGMTKGPEAKRLMKEAGDMDPENGWVHFSSARMHYHNPSFVGGDKDLALMELRELQKSMDPFRVRLYLALVYNAKEMYPQARYWALKAKAVAPDNPELDSLMQEIAERQAEKAES
jgi:hypothetical protein